MRRPEDRDPRMPTIAPAWSPLNTIRVRVRTAARESAVGAETNGRAPTDLLARHLQSGEQLLLRQKRRCAAATGQHRRNLLAKPALSAPQLHVQRPGPGAGRLQFCRLIAARIQRPP